MEGVEINELSMQFNKLKSNKINKKENGRQEIKLKI